MMVTLTWAASAAPGTATVSGVTTPFNGVWLESADGGHLWSADGNGLCRIDVTANGAVENAATCDVQAKAPTQAVVGPQNADGTYFVYVADMSSQSAGPVRLVYDPSADSGQGRIVANSAVIEGGLNTVGFFSDSSSNFRNSSVALGPCSSTITTPCVALYLAFERSKKIERVDFADQPVAAQAIETISKTNDVRKGVRYGIADFRNADGTDDLYIDELGGEGVSVITDVATCVASEGAPTPTTQNPPVNQQGGCAASVVPGITSNTAQGIAVQRNDDGTGRYLYVGDAPINAQGTILRYHPQTGFQDVVSSSVAPYDSLLNPGQTVTTYQGITGLAVNPHTGDLFIGDDPTVAIAANPPLNMGHIFEIKGDATQTAPADCTGSATNTCSPPGPPSTVTPQLYAYGLTAPKGGVTFVPSDDGGHIWAADHSQGLCRFDVVPQAPGLHAYNSNSCDDGSVLGSGGQTAYDDSIVPGTTNQHYLYVAQNDHLSPGIIRFTFDPSGDNGAGSLVPNSAVVMAPNAGLNGDKANGVALGPCKPGAPATCKHSLYVGGLLDGFIRRINNPEDDPRNQTVDVVAMTTEQRAGTPGRGINGSIGMLGDDLYLPENQGFTVVKNVSQCPAANIVCSTTPINMGTFGTSFGAAIGIDPDLTHSAAGLVYGSDSQGNGPATIYQYDVATNTSRIFATRGVMPGAGTAEATVYCTLTCTRPVDPNNPPGGQATFRFAQGLFVDSAGTVYLAEDALAGARGGRGHLWVAPFIPYPSGVTPVPLPTNGTDPTAHTCAVTVPVPALASGMTYWVQFTTHDPGPISSTWNIPVPQSAQLQIYPGNPFVGLADPVSKGPTNGAVAKQVTSNATSFDVSTAPTAEPAGTYTAQFFNGSNSFAATTATITYVNTGTAACPASPLVGHVAN
ncbi:MAG TPA: hypothetical protein VJX10_02015 [Pseudonocardiaceae bacterium]|nr:hypothetical protein [Pseudonocardiaceae bacterium]